MASSAGSTTSPSRRIRVMRLIARLNVGGPAIHTTLLTEKLNPQQFESELVAGVETEREGNMLELMGDRGVQPTIVPSLGREISPLNDLKTLRQVRQLMRQKNPHIVHTHTAKAGFVGRLAARLTRVPIVVHTFHGNVFRGYFSPAKTRLFIAIEKFLARSTDRIIVLSEQQKQEILSLGIGRPEQYQVIPLGLDLSPFLKAHELRGQLRQELCIAEGTPLIGIVARLVPIKAIHFFLQAAATVLKQHPNAIFLVVGDGELRAELEAQAKELGVTGSVRFLGFRSDLARIYADLDCSVLCSLNEGLPVAVIEALASARPVVATDVGSVRNLIGETEEGPAGYIVPSEDVEGLARGIIKVLDEPETAAKWGETGRTRVYPALDIGRLVNDIETLYLQLLRQKGIIKEETVDGTR
jgi:glycosyltransferase involved in cell wall biosynthesis